MTTSPETSPRDELARELKAIEFAQTSFEHNLEYHREAADALFAAGYRKPRTITAVEELDRELIVKSSSWLDAFYLPSQGAPFRNVVTGARVTLEELDRFGNFLPATVLWEPEA